MFGSHLSIAGGMHNALLEGERLALDTVQVFTKNQQQWRVRPLDDDAIARWLEELDRLAWRGRVVSHASYLINLASPDDDLWRKSIDLMQIEIERCAKLAIPFLVHHPGASTTSTPEEGIARIALAYKELFRRTAGLPVMCCLENTVGSGSNLGRTFEQLALLRARIIDLTALPDRVGFCLDTCHAHAGGYDLSTRESASLALDLFDQHCGMEHLHVVHLNDSKGALASRIDRHAHIGAGTIAAGTSLKSLLASGFAAVVNHPRVRIVPKILETPKENTPAGTPMDTVNLRRLRRLLETANPSRSPGRSAR